jgi:hypothetical protein
VKWKFWKKPNAEVIVHHTALPLSTLFRWYCYDLGIDDIHDLTLQLGLTPISEDAAQREEEDSVVRVARVAEILPFLDIMAQLNSTIATQRQTEMFDDAGIDKKQQEIMLDMLAANFYALSLSALVSTFSAALELDLIDYGGASAGNHLDIGDVNE